MFNTIVKKRSFAIVLLLSSLMPLSQALSCKTGTSSVDANCATVCQSASTYTIGTLVGTTTYSCATSSTCPSNSISGVGTGTTYACCSTADCNTGDVALPTPISCNVGTSAAPATATPGCYTSCQTQSAYAANVLTVTTYSCATSSTCPTTTLSSGTGFAYKCCSTANCNTGTLSSTGALISSDSTMKAASSFGFFTAAFLSNAKLNLFENLKT